MLTGREQFGIKLQFKANGLADGLANDPILQMDGLTELVIEVLRACQKKNHILRRLVVSKCIGSILRSQCTLHRTELGKTHIYQTYEEVSAPHKIWHTLSKYISLFMHKTSLT